MIIRRSPQSSNALGAIADQRTIDSSTERWEPGHIYWFNGTIDTEGKRHTDIGVEIEFEDILELFRAMVLHYATAAVANREAAPEAVQDLLRTTRVFTDTVANRKAPAEAVQETP